MKKFKFPKPPAMENMVVVYDNVTAIYSNAKKSANTCYISDEILCSKERRRFTLVDEKTDILVILVLTHANDTMYTEISGGSNWGNIVKLYSSDKDSINLDELKKHLEKNEDFYDEFSEIIKTIKTSFSALGGLTA